MKPASAALIAVGTELIADGRPDTNGAVLARLLAAEGIETAIRIVVPDEVDPIARALRDAGARHPLVIVTGGLGPTLDDVTREAAAVGLDLPLAEDPRLLGEIRSCAARRGQPPSPLADRQALVPRGATALANAHGTAPGLFLRRPGGGLVVLLPGVPEEMEQIMRDEVLPRIRRKRDPSGPPSQALAVRGLKVAGLSEAQVQQRLLDLAGAAGPGGSARAARLSLLASPGEISVVVRGRDPAEVDRITRRARETLGDHVFTQDLEEGLETVVGRLLASRGLTLATSESCTGGLLGALITRVPGSSRWFLQGWVTYANEAKMATLGIDGELLERHGAVSSGVAEAMARAARRLSGAHLALSITGIAGPEGGGPAKPVGLVYVALASGGACRAARWLFGGSRETVRLMAARAALDRLRRHLLGR